MKELGKRNVCVTCLKPFHYDTNVYSHRNKCDNCTPKSGMYTKSARNISK